MVGTPKYSTLEVNHHAADNDASGIEVSPGQRNDVSSLEVNVQKTYNGAPGLETFSYHNSDAWRQGENSHELSSVPYSNHDHLESKAKHKQTICGISKRVFIAGLIVGVLIIAGAIVGGVVGGLRKHRHTDKNATDTSTAPSSILPVSKLAAANRTAPDGSMYRTVIFQDGFGALISRRRLGLSTTWATTNITRDFESRSVSVNLTKGAAFAATACQNWGCGDTSVFYLGTDGFIHHIADGSALAQSVWSHDTIAEANLSVWAGSQLAVGLNKRFDGEGHVVTDRLVAYHGLDNFIHIANSSLQYLEPRKLENDLPNLAKDTCLAIIPHLSGEVADQISLVAKSIGPTSTAHTNSAMIGAIYTVKGDDWSADTNVLDSGTLPDLPASISMKEFAVTVRKNGTDSFYLALLSDGTLAGRILGQHNETISSIQLKDSSGQPQVQNFSAIATTLDGYFYGIANDAINEYSFDASNSSILHFEGVVYNESAMRDDMARGV